MVPGPTVAEVIGARVRGRRESLDMPQDRFASFVGIDRSYYGRIERGEANPSLGHLVRICEGLGCTLAELFEGL